MERDVFILTKSALQVVKCEDDNGFQKIHFRGDELSFGDQYHTMHELYQHRMALNIALFRAWNYISENYPDYNVMRSKLHYDGTMFKGYFIVMALTPAGQVSYHYKLKHWDKFDFLEEVERTPEYDGHTAKDVLERLMKV